MIQANELRIGNWILNKADGFVMIKNIQEANINLVVDSDGLGGSYSLQFFNGIPLTPSILEQCGFENDEPLDFRKGNFLLHNMDDHFEFYVHDQQYFLTTVKYVHQLQNLIFAISNQEIEVNLT